MLNHCITTDLKAVFFLELDVFSTHGYALLEVIAQGMQFLKKTTLHYNIKHSWGSGARWRRMEMRYNTSAFSNNDPSRHYHTRLGVCEG